MIVSIYNQDPANKIITKVTWKQYQDSLWVLINTVPPEVSISYAHNNPFPYSYIALATEQLYGEVRILDENPEEKKILKGISMIINKINNVELLILSKEYFKATGPTNSINA